VVRLHRLPKVGVALHRRSNAAGEDREASRRDERRQDFLGPVSLPLPAVQEESSGSGSRGLLVRILPPRRDGRHLSGRVI
jgi:hypothetical protein